MAIARPGGLYRLRADTAALHLRTFLAPGLPLALFEGIAEHLAGTLGVSTRLSSDPTRSAPDPAAPDPFARREYDLAFLCAPGYLWLAERRPLAVELVPAAFVFDDERCQGRPVYWAELVVRRGHPARSLSDLRGARWVYNDPCSLSGYFSVLAALRSLGVGPEHFAVAEAVGSHHAALEAIERGDADCAAIDSNCLLLERRRGIERALCVLESFGPFPVQPIVMRRSLPEELRRGITAALLEMHLGEPGRALLAECGVRRLAPIAPEAYEAERAVLESCEARPAPADGRG